jgi:hypothetical protein
VQPNEHRVFDQRWFQYEFLEKYIRHLYTIIKLTLLNRHEVHVTRQTVSASICPSTQAFKITLPSASHPTTYEISSLLPHILHPI